MTPPEALWWAIDDHSPGWVSGCEKTQTSLVRYREALLTFHRESKRARYSKKKAESMELISLSDLVNNKKYFLLNLFNLIITLNQLKIFSIFSLFLRCYICISRYAFSSCLSNTKTINSNVF